MTNVPKLTVPFSVTGGRVATIEQDELDQIAQCVYVLLATEIESRVELPEYGLPSQAFRKNGASLEEIRDTVVEWEPRVETMNIETEWEDLLQRVRVMISD